MRATLNITQAIGKRPVWFRALFGCMILMAMAVADVFIPPEFSIAPFYLLPVAYFTWFFRAYVAVAIAIVSAGAWLVLNQTNTNQPGALVSYWNTSIHFALFLVFTYIVSEIKAVYRVELRHSHQDEVTGIANRRAFYERISVEYARASRYGLTTTLAYVDIDDFKIINDTFGHQVGDDVLKVIAQALNSNVRTTDLVARVGGDEFCILMPQTSSEAAQTVLGKLQSTLSSELRKHGWPVTLSIGVVSFVRPPTSEEEMIKRADDLMYTVKRDRRGTVFSKQ